jgi:hypothetical protein
VPIVRQDPLVVSAEARARLQTARDWSADARARSEQRQIDLERLSSRAAMTAESIIETLGRIQAR